MLQIIRGSILNPQHDRSVEWIADGALVGDENDRIEFVGAWNDFARRAPNAVPTLHAKGLILPPFLDAHIHIPQWPIRGRFADGVPDDAPDGRLLAALQRNVFPAEARCADDEYTRDVVQQFRQDTLAKGVVGGCAYMTVHPRAAREALLQLNKFWRVGPVLMNQNCPEYLRTDESTIEQDYASLADEFGDRVVVTDRFAVAVSSALRTRMSEFAAQRSLRTQTHLNEQRGEKQFVEHIAYPDADSYTHVYARDGLLNSPCIVAHCIWMQPDEWRLLQSHGCTIAHCPVSNLMLGSGVVNLDACMDHKIEFAICTDVGASPTTSLLHEMSVFLDMHAGRSKHATPSEALYRTTLGAAKILGLDQQLGSFKISGGLSFIEVEPWLEPTQEMNANDVIRNCLIGRHEPIIDESARATLINEGITSAAELARIESNTIRRAALFDSRVLRTVLNGTTQFSRA